MILQVLEIEDFGAGSVVDKKNKRTISSIAKNAAKPKKFGQLFFRMAKHYQPATILELGTSLGITTVLSFPGKTKCKSNHDGRRLTKLQKLQKEILEILKLKMQK